MLAAATVAFGAAWYVVSIRTAHEGGGAPSAPHVAVATPPVVPEGRSPVPAALTVRAFEAAPARATSVVPGGAPAVVQSMTSASCVVGADYASLTVPQMLDRSMTYSSMFGVLRGTVGTPQARTLPEVRNAPGGPVADYPFRPRGFAGRAGAPAYEAGRQMVLRVPTDRQECGGRPVLAPGDEAYAVVRDQGGMAGGNTAGVLVVTAATDVYTVRAGRVHGQGTFNGFSEPIEQFEAHFRRP